MSKRRIQFHLSTLAVLVLVTGAILPLLLSAIDNLVPDNGSMSFNRIKVLALIAFLFLSFLAAVGAACEMIVKRKGWAKDFHISWSLMTLVVLTLAAGGLHWLNVRRQAVPFGEMKFVGATGLSSMLPDPDVIKWADGSPTVKNYYFVRGWPCVFMRCYSLYGEDVVRWDLGALAANGFFAFALLFIVARMVNSRRSRQH